eukprot:CAMPEP_0175845202 /NCGR_PEP_ID=MMETSP0107_2-20121207/22083_1 /TAXON_ID=195067 ORGANISM="Goniomonas pacifica, Strain CCMP1869" /NCGR_SAMPLE_ID=MMETSP0107_2 /ASSEMBLY_ACC=CAM_ASM_000203 /LENGTH=85 /DNA_ID=CAMNT_0017159713 /DNA_START=50 /DNA_END=308 /DNA_ORIENTATION=+
MTKRVTRRAYWLMSLASLTNQTTETDEDEDGDGLDEGGLGGQAASHAPSCTVVVLVRSCNRCCLPRRVVDGVHATGVPNGLSGPK